MDTSSSTTVDAALQGAATTIDAGVEAVDATIPGMADAAAKRPVKAPPRRRNKGLVPLDYLGKAAAAAATIYPDALLAEIALRGISSRGRVDLSLPRSYIYFRFYSPSQATRYTETMMGNCGVLVKVTKKGTVAAERVALPCSRLSPLIAPHCSLGSRIQKGIESGRLPADYETGEISIRMGWGRHPRPIWQLKTNGDSYSLPRC